MQHGTAPSQRDSRSASPRSKRPVHGETTGKDVPSKDKSPLRNVSSSGSSAPDGLDHVRFHPPDKESFVFDVTTGYRFDPSTGLHYDANSGFFINYGLEILLRWDPESNSYRRAGDLSGLGKPIIIPSAIQTLAASVLIGDEIAFNKNAAGSHSLSKKSSDGNLSRADRCNRSRSPMVRPSHMEAASQRKSNSPDRQRHGWVPTDRRTSESPRRSEQSEDRTRRRSVSWARNRSRTNTREPNRSRSREARTSRSKSTQRSGFTESRRSQSSRTGRSHSRLARRTCSEVARRSHSKEGRNHDRERHITMSCSPSRAKKDPQNRSSSAHRMNNTRDSERSQHRGTKRPSGASSLRSPSPKRKNIGSRHGSHSDSEPEDLNESTEPGDKSREETPEFIVIDNCDTTDDGEARGSPEVTVIDYGEVSDLHSDSQSEDETQEMKRRGATSADSQEMPPTAHHSTEHSSKPVPEQNQSPEAREESLEETPEFIVIDDCNASYDESREEGPEAVRGGVSSDSRLEDETRRDTVEMNASQSQTVINSQDIPPTAVDSTELGKTAVPNKNEGPRLREKSPGKTPKVISIEHFNVSADEPRKEVAVIDQGDALGHLFTDEGSILTNILLIAPVPLQSRSQSESDALKNQIRGTEGLLKVYVNHESTSGSPCHFMVTSFRSASVAKQWYDALSGTILLCGGGSKLKGYLHFLKKGNWNCRYCKSFNFFMQSICPKCYRAKNSGFSPVTISEGPTKLVGIAKLMGSLSTAEDVLKTLPPLDSFKILNTKVLREPSTDLFLGLCTFEVESTEEGTKLHNFFLQQKRCAIYVTLNETPKTTDEIYLDLLFGKTSCTNILHVALIPLSTIPDVKLELSLMEIYLQMLLKEDCAAYTQLTTHVGENVGAPYCYGLVSFVDARAAAEWLDSRTKTFNNFTASHQRSKVSLHFTEDNWECQGCHALNFCLRSLCHRCFRRKELSMLGPISESVTATRWVAISRLSRWSREDEVIIAHYRELLKEFIFKGTEVIRDSKCPLLPLACVFEMHDKVESFRLKEHLTKVGMFPVFVVVHKELNECSSSGPSSAPDIVIVDEPQPACIDLTDEDNFTHPPEKPELRHALNPKPTVVTRNLPSLLGPPRLAPPRAQPPPSQLVSNSPSILSAGPILVPSTTQRLNTDEQPSPLRISYTFPCKQPGDIITVSPVPYLGQDAKKFYIRLFLKDGAECESVGFYSENSFGVPYSYCLVKFRSSQSARQWFDKRQGLMVIKYRTFPHISVKPFKPIDAYFQFIGANWLCDCGTENSPSRSVCFRCYTQRDEYEPPLQNSVMPTKCVAVKLYKWYSANELAEVFPVSKCMLFRVEKILDISDPMIHRDQYGFYVFQTKTIGAAAELRHYCQACSVVKSTGFVELKDPSAGAVLELDSTFTPIMSLRIVNSDRDFDLISGSMEKPFIMGRTMKMVCPDYETFVWNSLYSSYLNNPPTEIVMISMCPGNHDLHEKARAQIRASLLNAKVNHVSILFCSKENYGSPFSYCLVTFHSPYSAQTWFDKCKGTFRFKVPRPDDSKILLDFRNCFSQRSTSESKSTYFIESKLHYSMPNWDCQCGSHNFPLRSVCHYCFVNRSGPSAYVWRPHRSNCVGIRLLKYFPHISASQFCLGGFDHKVSDVTICLDRSLPRDPCGIIIFRVDSIPGAVKLRKFFINATRKHLDKPHLKVLRSVLGGSEKSASSRLVYLSCQPFLESSGACHLSGNWDTYFSNAVPTDVIAVYHSAFIKGPPPAFTIPLNPYGGKLQRFESGGGFTPTFFLIFFPSPQRAWDWFRANCGILRNQNQQLNLYFTQGVWVCGYCSSPNFPARVLCYTCFKHRLEGVSPLRLSARPTRWVGIPAQINHQIAFGCLENRDFKFRSVRIIIDPVVLQDGPSVLVIEVSSPAEGMRLQDFLASKMVVTQFFVVSDRSETDIPMDSECFSAEIADTTADTEGQTPENPTVALALANRPGNKSKKPSASRGVPSAKRSQPAGTSSVTPSAAVVSLIESEHSDSDASLVYVSDDETETVKTHKIISPSVIRKKRGSCVIPESQMARTEELRRVRFASTKLDQSQVGTSRKSCSAGFSDLIEGNSPADRNQSKITSREGCGTRGGGRGSTAGSEMTNSENSKNMLRSTVVTKKVQVKSGITSTAKRLKEESAPVLVENSDDSKRVTLTVDDDTGSTSDRANLKDSSPFLEEDLGVPDVAASDVVEKEHESRCEDGNLSHDQIKISVHPPVSHENTEKGKNCVDISNTVEGSLQETKPVLDEASTKREDVKDGAGVTLKAPDEAEEKTANSNVPLRTARVEIKSENELIIADCKFETIWDDSSIKPEENVTFSDCSLVPKEEPIGTSSQQDVANCEREILVKAETPESIADASSSPDLAAVKNEDS